MRAIIEPQGPPDPGDPAAPLWKRLAWFCAIALLASLGTAVVAYSLKALLHTH